MSVSRAREYSMLEPEHAPALELVSQAINATLRPCRLEGTTFRSRALAIRATGTTASSSGTTRHSLVGTMVVT